MDNLFSLFTLYDLLGYIFGGAVLALGSYWAVAGLPPEAPDTVVAIGLAAAFYPIGHLVASLATIGEGCLWKLAEMPSAARMDPNNKRAYGAALRTILTERTSAIAGGKVPVNAMFALARARLREAGQDTRSETMNAVYGLCRNLAMSTALVTVVLLSAAALDDDWLRRGMSAALTLVATMLYAHRARRFSYRFADQVWHDFAALKPDAPAKQPCG